MSSFNEWLDRYLDEKNLDLSQALEVEGPSGWNVMPVAVVVEAIKGAIESEQQQIQRILVGIDFNNGDPLHFFEHLAQVIAK
jgi:hypothetical protein